MADRRASRPAGHRRSATTSDARILSLKQPWAWAVASGKKRIENRTWSTRYRGPVFIHASMTLDRPAIDWLREAGITPPSEFVHGAVIAVAEIVDVVTAADAAAFGPWFFGPYGFVLTNVRRLPRPVPERGRLGLAKASPELRRRVARTLRSGSTVRRKPGSARQSRVRRGSGSK